MRESVDDVGRTFLLLLSKALLYVAVTAVEVVSKQIMTFKTPFTKSDDEGDTKFPWNEDDVREILVGVAREILHRYSGLQVAQVKRLLNKAFEGRLFLIS